MAERLKGGTAMLKAWQIVSTAEQTWEHVSKHISQIVFTL